LFLDAIDLVMQRLKDAGLEFGRVLAVGGAAQVILILHVTSQTSNCVFSI
jgi:sugar (pentulose or hexulose) kinase